jgi:hypothetical protein
VVSASWFVLAHLTPSADLKEGKHSSDNIGPTKQNGPKGFHQWLQFAKQVLGLTKRFGGLSHQKFRCDLAVHGDKGVVLARGSDGIK